MEPQVLAGMRGFWNYEPDTVMRDYREWIDRLQDLRDRHYGAGFFSKRPAAALTPGLGDRRGGEGVCGGILAGGTPREAAPRAGAGPGTEVNISESAGDRRCRSPYGLRCHPVEVLKRAAYGRGQASSARAVKLVWPDFPLPSTKSRFPVNSPPTDSTSGSLTAAR